MAGRCVKQKTGTPNFPRATGSKVKETKPFIAGRSKTGRAIGKTTKAAVMPNAKSSKQKNHAPEQSTRESFIRRGATINVDSNVKGP
jgi:hypothetical protein